MTRRVRGTVLLPGEVSSGRAGALIVEARDTSVMDAPSVVVASSRTEDVPVEPGGRAPFELEVPDAEAGHTLSVRAHLSYDGSPSVALGDAISVTHIPLPTDGDVEDLEVPTRVV
jgi:uncharacterized lipoprotein YbaY